MKKSSVDKKTPVLYIDPDTHRALNKLNIYNPYENEKAISIIQQEDGNWTGEMNKFGKVVTARQGDPMTVLQELITHNGDV